MSPEDKTWEYFIKTWRKDFVREQELNIEKDYTGRPGYKKGDLKRFRKTEAYQRLHAEKIENDPIFQSSFTEQPDEAILEDFASWTQEREKLLKEERLRKELENYLEENRSEIIEKIEQCARSTETDLEQQIIHSIETEPQSVVKDYDYYGCPIYAELTGENLHLITDTDLWNDEKVINYMDISSMEEYLAQEFINTNPELKKYLEVDLFSYLIDLIIDEGLEREVFDYVRDSFSEEEILELLKRNPHYIEMFQRIEKEEQRKRLLKDAVFKTMPNNPTELFPKARKMKRKFFLHVGPTNSGKTHESIACLKKAEKGIYLAPLRLMAYEIYEKLNEDGVPCVMETGEEYKGKENANHYAKTIELFDSEEVYDVAVIDEAQMIADDFRGGAWTNAILGILAEEIHVCCSPDAKNIILDLIHSCNDEVCVISHERKTRLMFEGGKFVFPKSVKKGDAVIVFSKRAVIACTAELQKNGYRCSIIYGALPYDVRQKEVQKFLSGETDVVVSTDAIGMGMNLPVQRVVFLETSKFDGKSKRPLLDTEVKQIAGRAGRYGVYDMGYYTSEYAQKQIREKLQSADRPITQAMVSFPAALIDLDGALSEIMEQWEELELVDGYQKENTENLLRLAKAVERESECKRDVFSYVMIPFDIKNPQLYSLWKELTIRALHGYPFRMHEPEIEIEHHKDTLNDLEFLYKKYDLYYHFAKRGFDLSLMDEITKRKEIISGHIMDILKKKKFRPRQCKCCGKDLKWNYPYGICDSCYHESYDSYWEVW